MSKFSRIFHCLLVVGVAGVLAIGCGNGDGEEPDTTPPTVASTSPADGATDVAVAVEVTATFSEAMDPGSIDGSSVILEGPGSTVVTGSVSYNATTTSASFVPSVPLDPGVTYTATVTTGVTDVTGNALASDYAWSFTTADMVYDWEQVGGQVSPPGAESEDPAMLVLGTTPAVGYRHQSFRTYLNIWNGSDWGATEPDPSDNNTKASIYSTPDFCVSGQDVFMAYTHVGDATANDDTFYDRIFVYKWTDAAGWQVQNGGAEVSVVWSDPPGGVDAWEPAIACPSTGSPRVAWAEADVVPDPDTEYGAWVAEVSAGSSTRSAILSRDNADVNYYTDVRTVGLTVDGAGNAYLAQWEQDATEQWLTRLYVTRYDGGFTPLGGAISDDWDSNNLPVPSLAMDGSDPLIAYSEANDSDNTRHVYVKKYTGGNWTTVGNGPVSAFSPTDHYDSNYPDILVAEGTLWVAWQESNQYEGNFIYVAWFDEGNDQWVVDGDQLNVDNANDAGLPSLAYSPTDGYLYVAFEENTDGYPHIFVWRKKIN